MIAVIFEVEPADDGIDRYLEIAASLRSALEQVPGFISVERFRSLADPRKLLSLSFFESEEAVRQWRSLPFHRDAQHEGREGLFRDYRLRIAHVSRDYGMRDRTGAPDDSIAEHGA